jgi:hypothetical protein
MLGALRTAIGGRWTRVYDFRLSGSLAGAYRRRRLELFARLLASVPRPLRLLDVGGKSGFWERSGLDFEGVRFVILNLDGADPDHGPYQHVVGDARDLRAFADGEFDVVFSNSVIEHVGPWSDQLRMANAIRRVGRRYFIQTPNRRFPIEAHSLFPFFQYLPLELRARLLQSSRLGWLARMPDRASARELVESIRLLSRGDMRALFPEARLWDERVLGLTKSIVAYAGFDDAP